MTKQGWLHLMRQYARAHTQSHLTQPPKDPWGKAVPGSPWIGESLHPDEGWWLTRDYMYRCAAAVVMLCLDWLLCQLPLLAAKADEAV